MSKLPEAPRTIRNAAGALLYSSGGRPLHITEGRRPVRQAEHVAARYFGIVGIQLPASLLVYGRTGHYPARGSQSAAHAALGSLRPQLLESDGTRCIARTKTQLAPWPSSLAHNAAIYVSNDQWSMVCDWWPVGSRNEKTGARATGTFCDGGRAARVGGRSSTGKGDHEAAWTDARGNGVVASSTGKCQWWTGGCMLVPI